MLNNNLEIIAKDNYINFNAFKNIHLHIIDLG